MIHAKPIETTKFSPAIEAPEKGPSRFFKTVFSKKALIRTAALLTVLVAINMGVDYHQCEKQTEIFHETIAPLSVSLTAATNDLNKVRTDAAGSAIKNILDETHNRGITNYPQDLDEITRQISRLDLSTPVRSYSANLGGSATDIEAVHASVTKIKVEGATSKRQDTLFQKASPQDQIRLKKAQDKVVGIAQEMNAAADEAVSRTNKYPSPTRWASHCVKSLFAFVENTLG